MSIALSETSDSSIINRLPAVVEAFADARHPAHSLVRLDVGGAVIIVRITHHSRHRLGLRAGQRAWAQIKTVALMECARNGKR